MKKTKKPKDGTGLPIGWIGLLMLSMALLFSQMPTFFKEARQEKFEAMTSSAAVLTSTAIACPPPGYDRLENADITIAGELVARLAYDNRRITVTSRLGSQEWGDLPDGKYRFELTLELSSGEEYLMAIHAVVCQDGLMYIEPPIITPILPGQSG